MREKPTHILHDWPSPILSKKGIHHPHGPFSLWLIGVLLWVALRVHAILYGRFFNKIDLILCLKEKGNSFGLASLKHGFGLYLLVEEVWLTIILSI